MKGIVRQLIKQVRVLYANTSWKRKREYLIKQGAHIGVGTRFNCKVRALGTEPYLIYIGEDCLIADEVHFITHDGGVKVLNALGYFKSERMDSIAPIHIGDNVYIGTGAYIMPGITIGSNSIIGAAAVVTKDVPPNSVAVGIPAKVCEDIDSYLNNLKKKGRLHPTANLTSFQKQLYFESKTALKDL